MLSYTGGQYTMDMIENEKELIDILKNVFEQDEEEIREIHDNCIDAWKEYKSDTKKKRNYDKKKNNEIKKLKELIKKLKEENEKIGDLVKSQTDKLKEVSIKYNEGIKINQELKEENECTNEEVSKMYKILKHFEDFGLCQYDVDGCKREVDNRSCRGCQANMMIGLLVKTIHDMTLRWSNGEDCPIESATDSDDEDNPLVAEPVDDEVIVVNAEPVNE